jgi:DHA1 family tetracycline resistance protein-like MFS transporter
MRFIVLTVMLDAMGIGLLIPVAPRLVQQLGGFTDAEAGPWVGALNATYALALFACSSLLGVLSDRFGRRPVLLAALFGSALDYFVAAWAPTLAVLYITRAISGATGASVTVANAYIADVTAPEKRGAAFGMTMAAFGLGFVVGPLVGGVLGDASQTLPWVGQGDVRYPFIAAGVLTTLNWLYGLLVVPESLPRERRAPLRLSRANPIGAFRGLKGYPLVRELGAALFFLTMAQYALHATWVLYTGHRFAWRERHVGLSLFAVGLATFFVQGVLAGKIIGRIGERRTLMVGTVVSVLAYAGYGTAWEGWMMFVVIGYGCFAGISQPAVQAMITKTVRPDEQGATQGALSALMSISAIVGPVAGGLVFEHFTARSAWYVPGASFYMSAALAGVGAVIAWRAVRPGRHMAHGEHNVSVREEGA